MHVFPIRNTRVEASNDSDSAADVIIGGGLAGWSLARELRQRSPGVPITLVCADAGDFYAKPGLSNAIAQGKRADALVQRSAGKQAQALQVTLHGNCAVGAIDRATRTVRTAGRDLRYGRLVLALGADAVRLPQTPGREHAISVNDIDDYRRLRAALDAAGAGARVAIIGGGLIGCEFANDLGAGGYAVSVIDPGAWLIGKLATRAQGEDLQRALARLGVRTHLEEAVTRIEALAGGAYRLWLRSGQRVDADVVLSAIGLRPRTALARDAGLETGRGIVVDQFGRTGDPWIYALGDCAAYASAARADIDGGAARALPFVLPIMSAARALAATLTGTPTAIRFGTMPIRVKTPALPLTIQMPEFQ